MRYLLLSLPLLFCFACQGNKQEQQKKSEPFDRMKWSVRQGADYPHRDAMLDDLIANVKLHGLKWDSVHRLLGRPDRTDSLHLFYRISQERWESLILHTKTLVLKFKEDSTVEWRKIHQ